MGKNILCVEDNEQIQMFNKLQLEAKGFMVRLAMNLNDARDEMKRETPDLIILDIHLPDGNGLDFLRELRKTSNIPVIVLTFNKEDVDIVKGFASGCDDYMPKPYTFPVLYAHIEGLMRRAVLVPDVITKGNLQLNLQAVQATLSGEDLLLAQKEYSLLLLFMQNEGKTMSAEYIYEKVWAQPMIGDKNSVQTAVSKLRKKITLSGYDISIQRGQGYIFRQN